jgi:hypothetical protein
MEVCGFSSPGIACRIPILVNEVMATNNSRKREKQYHQPKSLEVSSLERIMRDIAKVIY